MDGKSVSQNSELTERGHHRRLSSILKAPRSPLKDLGSGNELCQEPALEKRRKSSRRVSFAETIRVFTPELQSAGSADKENEGFGAGDSCNSMHKGTADKCGIAGMDTLLHGPIHAPGHNVDWNYTDGVKDRTIFFSSDNDMDMTASNTVTIHGLIEDKTKKIDTSQFLASLKSQTREEVAKNQDFQLSFGVETNSGFPRDSSMENKIKFSDFLSSLGSGKSKATNCLDDADKENIFPFVPIHLPSQDNTGNVTQMFREQDDGLDLTRCHTTNIDSFFPAFNKEVPTRLIATNNNGNGQPKSSLVKSSALNSTLNRPPCNDQTVFMEDDMDITCSHTTRIRQDIPAQEVQLHTNRNETLFPSDKTIIFVEENEMELTKNNSVWLNRNQSVTSSQRKERVFCMEHTTILPQGEDMDITKSHTVAIDGLTMDRMKPQAMSQSVVCNMMANDDINGTACVGLKSGSRMMPNKSLSNVEHAQSISGKNATYDPFSQARQVGQGKTLSTISNLEPLGKKFTHNTKSDTSEKTVMFAYEQADMELTKSHTIAIDGKRLQDNKSYFSGLKLPSVCDKTILFSTDSDDMELTQSHTVCIDQKALNQGNQKMVSSGFQQRGQAENTDVELSVQRRTENTSLLNKVNGDAKRKSILNTTRHVSDDMEMTIVETGNFRKSSSSGVCEDNRTVLFTCDQQDMEITRSHTVSIDSLKNNTHNRRSNGLGFNLAVSKCPDRSILKCKEQDGYTNANEQEAGTKSSYGLPASGLIPAHGPSSEESTREACATLQNNTVFFRPDQGDMDITYSNTIAIKNTLLCGTSKANKSLLCVPATLKNIAADKTVFEDDMELTRSHTMIIDERDPIGLHDRSSLVKDVALSSALDIAGTKSNTICREVDTTLKVSKQQLHNETVHQDGDMEMTINAGLLVAAGKSQTWNKGNSLFLESFKDKTIYLCDQDDMDMTRAHTVSIENKVVVEVDNAHLKSMSPNHSTISPPSVDSSRLGDVKYISRPHSVRCFDEKHDLSRTQFDQDMDITVSNTVCIDNVNDLQLEVLPSTSTHRLDYMGRDTASDLVFDKKNRTQLEKDAPVSVETQDKTVFLSEQNDMDITRSHTTAIESKMVECTKPRKVVRANRNTAVNMADDATLMKGICSNDEDMDITKSNTVFIDHISNKLHNKGVHVSDVPKRKSLSSHAKRLGASNETILLVCNMEETNANINLTEKLINRSCFDKTLCNQGDMEITKSHTVAIENKTLDPSHTPYPVQMCSEVSRRMASCDQGTTNVCDEMERPRPQAASTDRPHAESVPPLISEPVSCKDLSIPPDTKDTTMTLSVTGKESELTKLQGNKTKDLLLNGDETVFPDEEQSMDITKAHTAAVEIHFLDHNSHIPSTSIGGIKDDTEVANSVKACGKLIETEQKCDNLNECLEKERRSGRNSYVRSSSSLEKSGIQGSENNELTQSHAFPVEDGGLMLDTSVGVIDHKNKEHISFRNDILDYIDLKKNPVFPDDLGSDYKMESLAENMFADDKSGYGNGAKNQLLERKSECLKMTGELIPVSSSFNCDPSSVASDSRDHVRPKEQIAHVLPEDANYKDPEVALEKQVKKAKLKGKRVSFHFPEKELVAKDILLDQEHFMPQENRNQVELQDGTVHVTDQISGFNSDFINQTSVIGMMKTAENLENNLQKDPEMSTLNPGFPKEVSFSVEGSGTLSEPSEKDKNKRRSIGDIQLKIMSLTQKSKMSSHHTAPVSSLIEQMPAPSQIVCPSSSETEHFLINAELPNTEPFEEKEPFDEENKTISTDNSLPNRFSVKMIKPKLPNKRASSTGNKNQEPVLSSVLEDHPQNDQSSKAILTALYVADDGPRIDEEILPDEQEINSIFDYEVPEGAWEDLCQDEALQQNSKKRALDTEDDLVSQIEKKSRRNEDILEKDEAQTSVAFKGPDKSYRSDYSSHHASKTMEQTYSSSSSQDSRGDGMSVELSSQQYSQMDSQLPWDTGCEQSLWQKFQDGTITVQEFFVLLRIRILIQKPRYSELPSKHGLNEELTAAEILRAQYVYQPKLQVYEEESHTLYQTIEELKMSTELQHKPLAQMNSLLWEAMRMCSENELMYFGVPLKNMKSLYSKKSKLLAHEEKVSTYSKLLHTAQIQCEQLQARLSETDTLLRELDDCISSLETETAILNDECRNESLQGCMQLQAEIDRLKSQEQLSIRESLELKERKEMLLEQLGSLQEEARVIERHLQEPSFTEWELVRWTDEEAAFLFLYDSLELSITFGEYIDGESFYNQPCRRISSVTMESQLNDMVAPPSSSLVHRLILQHVEKKGAFHETYKTQNNLPQLLTDLSLVVSRCKLLGEELEYLIKWGANYNIVKAQVQDQEVKLLFSSLAALVKFELIIHLSDSYPTTPLAFTVNNHIGGVTNSRLTEMMSEVPVGLWYLKRTVKFIHEKLLV